MTIAEEGCEHLLAHEDSATILTKLTASLGVDEAGDALLHKELQERIQDFTKGAPTPRLGGTNLLFSQIFTKKTHENEKKIGSRGGGERPKLYYVDPPLRKIVM